MERIPAACLMNWSIDLEKGLRSNGRGHPQEAIKLIGPRILSWSRAPCVSLSASKMYDLIPGEERSFANTIFIRLADTFLSGDNGMRSSILKIFLLELKHIKNEGRQYNGILSKHRLPNYLEMLKRLLLVFNSGDVKARALSLRLLGCWAPLTYDNADVQKIIISSLRSNHVLEMKASLFACGCLSLLANDFARVIIFIFVDILCSVSIPSDVKLASARAFGEIQCSSLLACKAFKSCQRLAQAASLEGYRAELLFSLTKIAIKSVIFIPDLVKFLFTIMVEEDSSITKSMALKCVRFLCSRGISHIFFEEKGLTILMRIVNDPRTPPDIQCEVLKTLRQIFRDQSVTCHEYSPDFHSLIASIQDAFESQCMQKRYLSLGLLVDISCHYVSRTAKSFSECVSSQSKQNVEELLDIFLTKHIHLLLRGNIVYTNNRWSNEIEDNIQETKQKYMIISNYVLRLVQVCPRLGVMFLNRFKCLIEDEIFKMEIAVGQTFSGMVFLCICYVIIPCLNLLGENDLIAPEVYEEFKLLMDRLQKVAFYGNDALEIISFKLFLSIAWRFDDQWIDIERFTLRLGRKMISKEKYWLLYKVGKYSSTNGLWFSATYIFKNLIPRITSDSCGVWLKSLMLLSGAESEIKLLLLPQLGAELVNELFFGVVRERPVDQEKRSNYEGLRTLMEEERVKLSRARTKICSSKEVLSTIKTGNGRFWFQTWFLNLREKGLNVLLELLGHLLLGPCEVDFSASVLTCISRQFSQLAREYDFMIVSFVDMDVKSSALISRLALYYSLLAYCSGFPLCFEGPSGMFLVEDLYERLSDVDCKDVLDLERHLPFSDWLGCGADYPKRLTSRVGKLDAVTLSVCGLIINGIHRLFQDAKNGEGFVTVCGRVQSLLNDVLVKWMDLPRYLPEYFFKLGDCAGAELFVIGDKTVSSKELSTFVGSQLSLNLCIQIKNIPPILSGRISEIHFILAVDLLRSASKEAKDMKHEESLDLHELLLLHMSKKEKVKADSATAYACVQSNSLGQGFSSCLLDVSAFPEGMYQIRWHACWVDHDDHLWSLHAFSDGISFAIKKPSFTDGVPFAINSKANGG